ncbi:MAG TPA: excinuclease ABC subunit UvrA [Bacteroidales bacterium]|nr:excinuclease ABC subunit UvrA [Bacteroidales bacterium]HOE04910.1 excinuclease ABC subunit UvrA [Bacteroidales bacterium]
MSESESIVLKGVRVHNLKNLNVEIPLNKLVVITGLSGSGKSSLAFDTVFAEGQRRYVESLSSYARQFMGRMNKPEAEYIGGIPPAIAIRQNTGSRNPRSTVGTITEIYEYIKLLFARIGKTYSPVSGNLVQSHVVDDVVNYYKTLKPDSRFYICFDYALRETPIQEQLNFLSQQGYSRLILNEKLFRFEEIDEMAIATGDKHLRIVLDRLVVKKDELSLGRVADSVQTAFFEGNGSCLVMVDSEGQIIWTHFSSLFEADGISFEKPTENMFAFNNPVGACPVCEGFGQTLGVDQDLVIPDKSLSVYNEAVVCWKGEKMQEWKDLFIKQAHKYGFPIHKPYYELTAEQIDLLWNGNQELHGINSFFEMLEEQKYKIQYRVMQSRYRGKTTCPSCKGTRLKKEAGYVKIEGKAITDLVDLPAEMLIQFFNNLRLNEFDLPVAERIVLEITNRLQFLCDVGLGYLSINRGSNTLSGGEMQRIHLATALGSSLVGSLYILDEPSIGLHPRDTHLLLKVLRQLRDLQNTVLVVEHEEEIIQAADYIIDIGPGAGYLGGEIVFTGSFTELLKDENSLTADYISGRKSLQLRNDTAISKNYIEICGARHHNLKNITVRFPLNAITVVTGVSGSGKTSLIRDILVPALKKSLGLANMKTGDFNRLDGDLSLIYDIEYVDQNPIGRSSRSNPATYIKAYDEIRKLFADQKQAQMNGLKPAHFSFNIDGGRCEECQGEGEIRVEMQFMADVFLECEACHGKRFKDEILEIRFQGKNIHDILEMTIAEAVIFFEEQGGATGKRINALLKHYLDVGLGYLKMGQSSNTFSGGENQRVKLATFLSHEKASPAIFVFDEPTTGLHFHDIKNLLAAMTKLRRNGHTLIIIEHNLEVIRNADWIVDLGPEGGDKGGNIVFEGTPSALIACNQSHTGNFLKSRVLK